MHLKLIGLFFVWVGVPTDQCKTVERLDFAILGQKCPFYTKDGLGILESPNFPGEYPAGAECHWRVRPGRNKRVLVIISNIELDENCGDVLTIRKTGANSVPEDSWYFVLTLGLFAKNLLLFGFILQIARKLGWFSKLVRATRSRSFSLGTRGTSGSTLWRIRIRLGEVSRSLSWPLRVSVPINPSTL